MKFFKYALLASTLIFASCSDDDDNTPDPVNEEEVITTLNVILDAGDSEVTLSYQDLSGDGSSVISDVSGQLLPNTVYMGYITLLNETEDPAENITLEIEEEDLDHQFFYSIGDGLLVTTEYADFDSEGNPLGLNFILTTAEASSGELTFTLRHEPTKPNEGNLDIAEGETDIEVTFDIVVGE
tara:strand:- start:251 stop:799 length:549 start_codon:yes stop_codon:yes gene_type:complete